MLLASDGLLSLSDNRIAEILAAHAADDPAVAAAALLAAVGALRVPDQDNTTVLLAVTAPAGSGS